MAMERDRSERVSPALQEKDPMNMNPTIQSFATTSAAGEVIAEARRNRRYTLEDLAETSGLTISELSSLENGGQLNRAHALRAGAALGIAPSSFGI